MDATQLRMSEQELIGFTNQHNAMLHLCSQLANLNVPELIRVLNGMYTAASDGPPGSGQDHTRKMIEDNLVVARLALEIHGEVNRQIRSRPRSQRPLAH